MTAYMRKYKLTYEEVAQVLENFIEGKGGPWAWDGFTLGMSFDDNYLEDIRKRCVGLSEEFPPQNPHEYCNEQGRGVIRGFIAELRSR